MDGTRQPAFVKLGIALAATLATGVLAATAAAAAPVTSRVSLEADGSQRTAPSFSPSISADGTLVAYESWGPSAPSGLDVYAYDRPTGNTESISDGPLGVPGDGDSLDPSVSADGRFVAFASSSANLVPGDTNGRFDVFVRDRRTGGLERISDSRSGNPNSFKPSISGDGRFVAFVSDGPQASLGHSDVLLHDRKTGENEVISPKGPRLARSDNPSVSGGGRFVAFEYGSGIAVRDRRLQRTQDISAPGTQQVGPAISASGRFVAFASETRQHPGEEDYSITDDIFVYNRETRRIEMVSVAGNGRPANNVSGGASVSHNGRYVAFASRASNLVAHDTNGYVDVFVRDRRTDTTRRVSISSARNQADGDSGALYGRGGLNGFEPSPISAGGRFVAFASWATNLVRSDTQDQSDVFLRGPLTP